MQVRYHGLFSLGNDIIEATPISEFHPNDPNRFTLIRDIRV